MRISAHTHTIFLTVGPSEAGKTTFVTETLIPALQFADEATGYRTNIQYLSSDSIRQDILGYAYDKYNENMMEASAQAFSLLYTKLDLVTQFPINCDYAIVDTTGLSEGFRDNILEIGRKNNYRVEILLFDYKNIRDHYASDRSKRIIAQQLTRMRQEVLPNLKRNRFDAIHRIREKNFTGVEIVAADRDEYLSHLLPHGHRYVIIGDVHEQVDALKELVKEHGFAITDGQMSPDEKNADKKFVLIGDYIDKGGNTKATIDFLYNNKDHFLFVKGNHENFVYHFLNGNIKENNSLYFDSIPHFEEDTDSRAKFEELFSLAKDFYRFIGLTQPGYYITHAPCENKYLGKLDKDSRKAQRRFATNFSNIEDGLHFLKEEAVNNHPFHVWGHIATKDVVMLKKKLGIDTGAVHGNTLTSVTLNGNKPFYRTIKAGQGAELPVLFSKKEKAVDLANLEESSRKRLGYVLENKINYISGTMSPANKDLAAGVLESLKEGLYYFKNKGVAEVVLQPKYMGSRCTIYLTKGESYATSRNGFKVNHVELGPVYEALLAKFSDYMERNGVRMLVLDGELLPWSALGKGLIDKQFKVVEKALETELSYLKENGFEEQFGKLVEQYETSGFKAAKVKSSKKDLVRDFGTTAYGNYKDMDEILDTYHPLDEHIKASAVFKRQLELYGKESEVHYKPFNVLKIVYEDGREEIPEMRTSEIYSLVNGDRQLVLNLNEDASFALAEEFFQTLTMDEGMEGVVIKPQQDMAGVVPFMKVRNPEYLTIVYGYDYTFPHKYRKLLKEKAIAKKLQTSLNEHRLGRDMLVHPASTINETNVPFQQTVANLLFEEQREKELDPRL
ncbi:metallophosphoesterase [Bacillus sp. FJAT-18017]|uniref:metallophosphoesterase n=1 Tax=Bacillus sp. FJAT-18017 TaxID=1705566 RepID=UPI0006AFA8DA|nr:metallophosphoesterase [Bacillus sp. FJAT-18017]ALC89355.1 metallophosphoesterase [Bacillus sp. FJAT-18017]